MPFVEKAKFFKFGHGQLATLGETGHCAGRSKKKYIEEIIQKTQTELNLSFFSENVSWIVTSPRLRHNSFSSKDD